jgi:hypothetical protein
MIQRRRHPIREAQLLIDRQPAKMANPSISLENHLAVSLRCSPFGIAVSARALTGTAKGQRAGGAAKFPNFHFWRKGLFALQARPRLHAILPNAHAH